jgi:hypothetical protein
MLIGSIACSAQQKRPPDGLPDVSVLLAEGAYAQAEVAARAHVNKLQGLHGDDSLQVAHA